MKYKETWKNPGYINKEFAPFDVLKPKVLNYWEQMRVNMPERSYERYSVNKAFKLVSAQGKEFGFDNNLKQYAEQYRVHLAEHNKKFKVRLIYLITLNSYSTIIISLINRNM